MSQLSKEWWKIKFPWLDKTRRSLRVEFETVLCCSRSPSPRSSGCRWLHPTSAQLQKVSDFVSFLVTLLSFVISYPSPCPTQKSGLEFFSAPFSLQHLKIYLFQSENFRSNSACSHSTSLWGGKCGQMSGRKMPFGKLFDLLHSIES